jgi:hypothetical protein
MNYVYSFKRKDPIVVCSDCPMLSVDLEYHSIYCILSRRYIWPPRPRESLPDTLSIKPPKWCELKEEKDGI